MSLTFSWTLSVPEFVPTRILQNTGSVQFSNPNDVANIIVGQNVTSIAGVSINMKCPVRGTPDPKVTWFYNQTTLFSRTSDVIIPKMMWKYVGVYTCVATQGDRTVTANTHLTMLGKNSLIVFM